MSLSINFSDTNPAAPTDMHNVSWQASGNDRSGNVPLAPARQVVSMTTGSLAPAASEVSTVALATSFTLIEVTVNYPARIELYATAALQAVDASRPSTQPPSQGTANGVIVDLYLTRAQTFILSPQAHGSNCEVSPSKNITYCVNNLDTQSRAITVTYTFGVSEV